MDRMYSGLKEKKVSFKENKAKFDGDLCAGKKIKDLFHNNTNILLDFNIKDKAKSCVASMLMVFSTKKADCLFFFHISRLSSN